MRRTEIEQIKTLIRPYIRDKNRYINTPLYMYYKGGVLQTLDKIDMYAEAVGYNHKSMSEIEYNNLLGYIYTLYKSGQETPKHKSYNHAVALSYIIVKIYYSKLQE